MRLDMTGASPDPMTTIDEIIDNFSLLEDWDDRYRYVIELGRGLAALSERDRTETNKVQGCASQVWLAHHRAPERSSAGPMLIVRPATATPEKVSTGPRWPCGAHGGRKPDLAGATLHLVRFGTVALRDGARPRPTR